VPENRVVRRLFGFKRNTVAGGWWKQDDEKLHYVYSSSNIITDIKSRIIRCAGMKNEWADEKYIKHLIRKT
jgi:hypothetical protein